MGRALLPVYSQYITPALRGSSPQQGSCLYDDFIHVDDNQTGSTSILERHSHSHSSSPRHDNEPR